MTAPAAELQKAIFAELGGDAALLAALGGERIIEQVPADAPFPYIGFGRTSVYDWCTGTEKDTEQLFTLHIWSKAKGEAETVTIMDIARSRLADKIVALDSGSRSSSSSNSPRRATTRTLPCTTACCVSARWRRRRLEHLTVVSDGRDRLACRRQRPARFATQENLWRGRLGNVCIQTFIPRSAGIG